MDLLDLMVRIGVKDEASDRVSGIGGRITGLLGGAAKAGAAAIGAIYTGVTALTGAALKSYSEHEQLVGGVDKLYGSASGRLQQYAAQAYQTSGMSANQYMQQATSFSAALITSLGGDTKAAADLANTAMVSMSDNVNVFGSNMEDVQNAYQGFAKQNYTMLDNLKLGYAGTKEGMEQLVHAASTYKDAQDECNLSVQDGDLSFVNIVKSIQVVQQHMGIAGDTAEEAMHTIQGSVTMAKAAWDNWVEGLGDDDADMSGLTQQLLDSMDAVVQNVAPRIGKIGATIVQELPTVAQSVASALPTIAGPIITAAGGIVKQVVTGIGPAMQSALGGLDSVVSQAIGHAAAAGIDVTPILRYRDEAKAAFDNLVTTAQNVGKAFQDSFSHVDLSALKSGLQSIIDLHERMTQGLANIDWSPLTDGLAAGLQHLSDIAGPAMTRLTDALSNPVVQQGVQALVDIVGTLAEILGGVLGVAINVVLGLVQGVILVISNVLIAIDAVKNGIVTGVSAVIAFFGQLPGAIGGFLASVIQSVVSWAQGVVSNARSAGSNFVNAVGSFFGQLPGKVGGFLTSVIGRVVSWVSQMASHATSAGSRFLSGIGSAMTSLPGRIGGFLSSALGKVAAFAGSLATRAVQAGQGFLRGIQGGFQRAVSFVGGIPGRIRGAIGSLGGLLLGAGKSVMDGLLNGLKSGFGAVKDFVGGIAGWIKSHKGPIEYDRRLLIPNGMAIMASLADGLTSGFEGSVAPYVRSVAGGISGALSAPFDVSAAGVVDVQQRGVSAAVQQGNEQLERWLETRLGPIIERYAPTATPREFGRMVRSYA